MVLNLRTFKREEDGEYSGSLIQGQLKICLEFRREVGIEDKMTGDITSTQLFKLNMREILGYFLFFFFKIIMIFFFIYFY